MTGSEKDILLSQEYQLAMKLESIFMPHARRQRDQLYVEDADPRFVHYTSAENALNILKGKRLWMRPTVCMSDYREVQHGFDILAKFFSDKLRMETFCKALDESAAGAAQEAINLFNGWWETIRFHTYISSISEHASKEDFHGRLSMWRAFGQSTARVAIVFKILRVTESARALNLMFSPVAYLTEVEVHDIMNDVINNMKTEAEFLRSVPHKVIVQTVYQMLLAAVTCLKHEGFREEREWRAIYSPRIIPSPLMESSVEVVGGVPQIIHKIPLDVKVSPALADLDLAQMFDRLIIGASPYPLPIAEAFIEILKKAGVSDAEKRVFVSGIPIRS